MVKVLKILLIVLVASCADHDNVHQNESQFPKKDIAQQFGNLTADTPPDSLYKVFSQFCLNYFGAKTDTLYYHTFGDKLKIKKEGRWQYVSERSVALAWQTNLPSKSYVEYGENKSYDRQTEEPKRYFFTHLQYLKNLSPQTRYNYRIIAVDERGNKAIFREGIFRTKKLENVVYIPGERGDPPYILDQANTTYIVTDDIIAGGSVFDIRAGGITLDLGGHTIVHANELVKDLDYQNINKSGVGIRRVNNDGQSGLKIFNGTLKQGKAKNNQNYTAAEKMVSPDPKRAKKLAYNSKRGFSSIEITKQDDVEIAGVSSEYHLPQVWGMRFEKAFGKYNIHHNVFLDKGTQMFSRHGLGGARSLGFKSTDYGKLNQVGNGSKIHHNLVKRTRQNTFNGAQNIFHNEIYVDSWVVNSFGIQPVNENGYVYGNKIFLTGYYAVGILWADKGLRVNNNFIHMESVRTMINPPNEGHRLIETWGEQDVLAGMRLTNYYPGGDKREDLTYKNNVILGRARDGAKMRGTEFYSDSSVKNLVFKDNTVKVMAADSVTTIAACIDAQGTSNNQSAHLPISYINNTLISNICNIRFGDDYGQGSNHQFINCNITKAGDNPNYHTFVFDGGESVFNHGLLNPYFAGGARYDDVYWEDTRSFSNYSIKWALTVLTNPGARVTITDKYGNQVYSGSAADDGFASIPLTQSIIRPVEWGEDREEISVKKSSMHQGKVFMPYTVAVKFNGRELEKTIDLNKKMAISMIL